MNTKQSRIYQTVNNEQLVPVYDWITTTGDSDIKP